MEWSAFGPRASNDSIDSAPSSGSFDSATRDRWSSSERALRVSQNDALQALLNDSIRESGFLTSAGHRAIVQDFLHSDAVDREMTRVHDERPQKSLFRRIASSEGSLIGSVAGSADGLFGMLVSSDGSATGSVGSAKPSRARRRGSRDLLAGALRRFSGDLTMDNDFDPPCNACYGYHCNANGCVGRNIAPRRASHERRTDGGDDIRRRLERSEDASYYKYVDAYASDFLDSLRRNYGSAEAILGPQVLDSLRRNYRSAEAVLEPQEPPKPSDAFGPPPRTERAGGDDRDDRSVRSVDDSCADECGWLPWPEEEDCAPDGDMHMVSMENLRSDDDSCADASGWLPWPEEEDCAPDGDMHMVSMENLRSDDKSCPDECGWLPWPEGKHHADDDNLHMVSMENLQED